MAERAHVLLAAQRALLGEIPPVLRAVTLGWSTNKVQVCAIFDGEASEDHRESMECVGTEIIASFPDHAIEVEFARCDAPARVDAYFLMAWAYMRKESS